MEHLKRRMDAAAEAASRAGEITLHYYQRDPTVEQKADLTPVTAADREAEKFLLEHLGSRFPEDGFAGEESGERPGKSGYRWVVDPIDGTKAFIQGVPLYGVLVGLEGPGREPLVGAIALPPLGELLVAARGEGCFWSGRPARVSEVDSLSKSFVVFGEEECFERESTHDLPARLHRSARCARGWGDCFGHALVATGRAEAMLDPIVEDWDAVALLPIVEEAGGVFTDWRGRRTALGKSAVSTNAAVDAEVRALIAEFR